MSYLNLKNILIVSLVLGSEIASSAEKTKSKSKPKTGEALVVYVENDSKNIGGPGSDQAYSNGFKISYIYAEDKVPKWAEFSVRQIEFLKDRVDKLSPNLGLSLGHQIYTPNKISTPTLIKNDRPYASWLYLGFSAALKDEKVGHFMELDLGMVGSSALGKQVQNNFHDFLDAPRAYGWSNQLKNEPTIQTSYQQRHLLVQNNYVDVVPYFGGSLGNVLIAANVGAMVRLGVNLADDFGPTRPSAIDGDSYISPAADSKKSPLSYYVFAGTRGNAVAKNIFLDGNTWEKSHNVTKYPFTFETEFGAGMRVDSYGVVWRFVTRSPEFEERSRFNSFASLNFVVMLD